ncbi:MAG TPA: hypothetical protein VK507_08115 [Iamia sp.]|nr:hypothetical protein [Iamia sp.]
MAALTDHRLTAIDRHARQRLTAMDRVTIELVAEIRRLRDQGDEEAPPDAG